MKNNCLFCLYNHFIFTSSGSISLNSIPLPVHEIAPVFVGSSSRVTFYNNVDCKKIRSAQCSLLITWSKGWPGTARAGGTRAGLGLREKNWNLGEPFCPAYTFFSCIYFSSCIYFQASFHLGTQQVQAGLQVHLVPNWLPEVEGSGFFSSTGSKHLASRLPCSAVFFKICILLK